MSALDSAREEVELCERGIAPGADTVSALRALIAEHERVLAERAAPQEWEYGVRRFDGVTVRAASEWHARILVRDDARYKTWTAVRCPKQPKLPWEPLPEDTNHASTSNEGGTR